jgi:hypothetical protein
MIHKTLYSFSNAKLHFLFNNSEAFRLIIYDSLLKNDRIFNKAEKYKISKKQSQNNFKESPSFESNNFQNNIFEIKKEKSNDEDIYKCLKYL